MRLFSFLLAFIFCFGINPAVSMAEDGPRVDPPRKEKPGTVAIVASGPRAGEAVFRALQAAEKIASGSIHGTVFMYAIMQDGTVREVHNFGRGGTGTLFVEGEETGVAPPPEIAEARVAGIWSTGPRKPVLEPYDGKYPWFEDGVGFVIGHRIPDDIGFSGLPVDHEAFLAMKSGVNPKVAVEGVLSTNPQVDAGLIAANISGEVGFANSKLVEVRTDFAQASGRNITSGSKVETILNEIHPQYGVAQLIVSTALRIMGRSEETEKRIILEKGVRLELGSENLVEIDDRNRVTRIQTQHPRHLDGHLFAAVPYLNSRVVRNGSTVGHTTMELLAEIKNGSVLSLSFQPKAAVTVSSTIQRCKIEAIQLTVCR